jgi:hypothetical protein
MLFLGNGCLIFASLFGMETLISALLLTVLSFLWWQWSEQRLSWSRTVILAIVSLLCVMCRPDFLLWIGVACVTAITFEVRRWMRGTVDSRSVILLGVTCLAMVLPAIAYMIVKYIFFGMRLPNPYYVKSASSVIAYSGLKYVVAYLLWVFPLSLGMCMGVLHVRSLRWISQFMATSLYIAAFVRFEPLMGTAFRFLLPVFPTMVALGLVGLQFGLPRTRGLEPVGSRYLRLASVSGIVLWLCIWSLSSYLHVERAVANQNTKNYQCLGIALAKICDESGEVPTVATGDQGALPFYSGWNALDFVGLTDNTIARMRDGAAVADHIIGETPDLVVVRRGGGRHSGKLSVAHGVPGIGDALVKNPVFQHNYAEVGSIPDEDGDRIVFFVDRQSSWAGATTAALLKGLADIAGAEIAGTYSSGGGMHD